MIESVLKDTGKETLDKLSYRMYHGEDSDFDPVSNDPEKVEEELRQHIESKGFDCVIPSEKGGGVARQPFCIPDRFLTEDGNYVVKFARYKRGGESGPEKGRIQNHHEVKVWQRLDDSLRQYFVPIRDFDQNYFWLVMDFAKCFDNQDQYIVDENLVDKTTDEMMDAGVWISDYGGSFGKHQSKPKCLDYGMDVQWYDRGTGENIVRDDEWGDYDTDRPEGMM
jgi:hypothetical protein